MDLSTLLTGRNRYIALGGLAAVVVLIGVVLVVSGGGDDEAAPTTTTTSTTTTTEPEAPTYPLTGLPVDDEARAARTALVVKIDNAQPRTGRGARPQAGINQADVIFEEVVEGSVTRLVAVFHSGDSDPVGPVRSARTTDLLIMASLNRPLFAWSGANAGVAAQVREAPIVDVGYDAASGAYNRASDRPAPYNLFSTTARLREAGPDEEGRPPPRLFAYRKAGVEVEGGEPVAGVHINFGGGPGSAPVDFRWNDSGWARDQRGEAHVDVEGQQVAPPNVVIRFTPYAEVQCCDAAGFPIVEAQLEGDGDAWVLTGGALIEARWSKTSIEEPTAYTTAGGDPILLTPGRTWVAIAPPGSASRL